LEAANNKEKEMTKETGLEKTIKDLYTRSGYGRVLKAEIDALVFHHFLLEFLGEKDLLLLGKRDIFDLSVKLKVSESKIKRLLEDDYIIYPPGKAGEPSAVDLLRNIVSGLNITRDDIKDGKIRIPTANPIAKKHLELAVYDARGIPDTSFNREILVLGLGDFFRLLRVEKDAGKFITEELKRKIDKKDTDREEAEKLLQKPLPDLVKDLAVGLGAKLLGSDAAGDLLFRACDKGIKLFLEKAWTPGIRDRAS
jgi:hypothetical protein